MATVGLIIVFAAMAILDYQKVWRKEGLKEKAIYALLLGLAFGLSELHVLGFRVIGLNQILGTIMRGFGVKYEDGTS